MKHKLFLGILLLVISFISCTKDSTNTTEDDDQTINVNLNRQNVGSSANDLLSDLNFTRMVIELVYVEGFEPNQNTVNNFVSFLQDRTFKPNGITVEKRAIASPGNESYTIQDIVDIEIEERQNYNTEDTIAVWAFFADAESANNNDNNLVLGTAYWNTSFVIFEETINDLSGGAFQPDRTVLETTVITHEFGHILGLTALGSPMQQDHEDDEHPKHCNVDSCLMFWATESSAGIDAMLDMTSAPELDAQCITDLQANGGK